MNFKFIINESLKKTAQAIGVSSIAASSYYNPLLPLYLISYDLITKYFATPLTIDTFGKEYGAWTSSIFDPTNALLITLIKPNLEATFKDALPLNIIQERSGLA